MARARLILLAASGVVLTLFACGPPAASPTPAADAPRAPATSSVTALAGEGWGRIASARYELELTLPEASAWAVNDHQESWLVAQHAPSRSEIRMRTWRAQRTNAPDDCWQQARLWRPDLPRLVPETLLEQRPLLAPPGYRGAVSVGIVAPGAGLVEGYVVAIGARTGRCFAFWYRTRVRGAAAEAIVAENLAVISAGVVDRIEESCIEEAVRREPMR